MALQIQTAPTGVVRDAHFIIPHGASEPVRTLLGEPQATNLLLWSQDATQAAWTKTDTTPTANAAIAPTGAATADLLVEGSAGTANLHQSITVTAGASVAASRWLKRDNHDWVLLEIADDAAPTTNFVRGWVNLATGAVGSTTVGGAGVLGNLGLTVEATSNGWYRFCLVGQLTAITAYRISSRSASADASTTRVNGARRWEFGRQGGVGVTASSYIVTEGAAVARNADSLSWLVTSLVPQELTLYYRVINRGESASLGADARSGIKIGDNNGLITTGVFAGVQSGVGAQTWAMRYRDGTNNNNSPNVSLPNTTPLNSVLEFRGVVQSDWQTRLGISVNNAAEVESAASAGSAGAAAAFTEARVQLPSGLTTRTAAIALTHLGVFRGDRDRAYCRANTGVV
jgi:hypothetical protein